MMSLDQQAEQLTIGVEKIRENLTRKGTSAEKDALLPKLQEIQKAIGQMTVQYDERLLEVRERNHEALEELMKIAGRVGKLPATQQAQGVPEETNRAEANSPENKENEGDGIIGKTSTRNDHSQTQMPLPGRPAPTGPTQPREFATGAPLYAPRPCHWQPLSSVPESNLMRQFGASPQLSASPPLPSPTLSFIGTPSPSWEGEECASSVGRLLVRNVVRT